MVRLSLEARLFVRFEFGTRIDFLLIVDGREMLVSTNYWFRRVFRLFEMLGVTVL